MGMVRKYLPPAVSSQLSAKNGLVMIFGGRARNCNGGICFELMADR